MKAHFWLPPDARVTIDTFYDRIHPDDRGPTRAAIERSIADGRAGYPTSTTGRPTRLPGPRGGCRPSAGRSTPRTAPRTASTG